MCVGSTHCLRGTLCQHRQTRMCGQLCVDYVGWSICVKPAFGMFRRRKFGVFVAEESHIPEALGIQLFGNWARCRSPCRTAGCCIRAGFCDRFAQDSVAGDQRSDTSIRAMCAIPH